MSASKRSSRTSGLRVLLVEDENLIALLLEDMLADLGHTVIGPIGRLNKALEIAQRDEFDIAILDVNINGGDTYPIAEALAARDIPFVFSTGYGRNSLRAAYHDRPILQKPFLQDDLKKLFAEMLP